MTQPTLDGLAGPRRRRRPSAPTIAEELPVARVVVDRPGAHLDRPFDYAVPRTMSDGVRPGVRVRVRFAGQDADAYVVERTDGTEHDGELLPLRRLVSPEVVLTPAVLRLCRAVADRWAGTLADVLRLAVPPRHARTEAEDWAAGPPAVERDARDGGRASAGPVPSAGPTASEDPIPPDSVDAWAPYVGGPAFLRHVAAGRAPRAVWSALPGDWAVAVAHAVRASRHGGRGALVVVPDAAAVADVEDALERAGVGQWHPGASGGRVRLVAEDGPAQRYRAFLAVVRGVADVVVGTRAASFAPVRDLGLVVCWDDGDGLHAEPRAPYPHARDVLAMRSEAEETALLVGGLARSVAAQRWVEDGWAAAIQAPRDVVRRRTPRVRALGPVDLAAEGPAAAARLPSPAWRAVARGLETGPVLVQVPRAGYVPVVACARCRTTARCQDCHGPLGLGSAGGPPSCRWCGRLATGWRCARCRHDGLRSVRVGSARTAEELGRAFPGVTVRTSDAARGVLRTVPDRPALVVATPGAEPRTPSGYVVGALLDAAVTTGRDGLDVAEQALRTWMNAAALVRPAERGGEVLLVGDGAPGPTQALVRWDPAGLAGRELEERSALLLPPAVHVVVAEGPRGAVEQLLGRARLPASASVLGPLPDEREPERDDVLLELADEERVRAIVRTPWPDAPDVVGALVAAQAARSAHREPGRVRLRAEPPEV